MHGLMVGLAIQEEEEVTRGEQHLLISAKRLIRVRKSGLWILELMDKIFYRKCVYHIIELFKKRLLLLLKLYMYNLPFSCHATFLFM